MLTLIKRSKKRSATVGCLTLLFCLIPFITLAETGHYVNGKEALKAASLPPPGVYYRSYEVSDSSNTLMDSSGEELPALVNRLILVRDKKILGENIASDIVSPLVQSNIKIGAMGVGKNQFGLGDIVIEPILLSWHGARYEMHEKQLETGLAHGENYNIEWGVGNKNGLWDVGVVGYATRRLDVDKGPGATNTKDQVRAIGFEDGMFVPFKMMFASAPLLTEFDAKDRPEGNALAVMLKKYSSVTT